MDHAPASSSDPDPVPLVEASAEPAAESPAEEGAVDAGAEEPVPTTTEPAVAIGPIQDRVLVALKAHITPALPSELAAALGVPEKTLKRLLGKMARDGSVRRAGGGRFTVSRHYRG